MNAQHPTVSEQVPSNSWEERTSLPVVVLFLVGFSPSPWRCPGTALAQCGLGRGRGEGGAGSSVDAAGAGHAVRVCAGARER